VTVTGLVVGQLGLLERLGIGAPESRGSTAPDISLAHRRTFTDVLRKLGTPTTS
jgi:hypothetical protein